MKRVRCPKCGQYVIFDETTLTKGQPLKLLCPHCGKEFGIRIGADKPANSQKLEVKETNSDQGLQAGLTTPTDFGSLVVIENVFHYKQELPLHMGDNQIGRYQKGNPVSTPIATDDPSVDLLHCIITVGRDKHGRLQYTLRDANSNTGTFVDNTEIPPRERRIIYDGQLFTIGATSIILRAANSFNSQL